MTCGCSSSRGWRPWLNEFRNMNGVAEMQLGVGWLLASKAREVKEAAMAGDS